MKANELRVGNYVNAKNFHIKDIEEISQVKCDWIRYSSLLEPIPLTEEWLLKFGFETRKESDNFYYFGFGENPITKDWMLCLKYFKDENKFFFMNGFHIIKYVHQLQNLYFALTGEELQIKK